MDGHTKLLTLTKKASFWRRLIAFTIDALIVTVTSAIIAVVFEFGANSNYLFNLLLFYAYNIIMDYYKMGTIGKLYTNIRVVGEDGLKPNFINSVLRNLGKIISGIPLFYGFLLILAPHVRQTLHDQLGKCYVVKA
jgi:uncharacterized RDD family membrane protein YckC